MPWGFLYPSLSVSAGAEGAVLVMSERNIDRERFFNDGLLGRFVAICYHAWG
jgi:hypothetical protein